MSMDENEFDSLFDPEMIREFREKFTELNIKRQQEQYEEDPEYKWFLELSIALSREGIRFFRNDEKEMIYIQSVNDTTTERHVESIALNEIQEYMIIGVPAEAVAAAIRAGLLSSVFKFWRKFDDESED
jgi:hypothetical protein